MTLKRSGIKLVTYNGRIPGVIYLGKPRTAASRMAAAYDKMQQEALASTAGDILKDLLKTDKTAKELVAKNPELPEAIDPTRIKVINKSTASGDGLKSVLSKINVAFDAAASARRNFKEAGGNPKNLRRAYFFTKTLKSEFGGDLIQRTKGALTNVRDPLTDAGSSSAERLTAAINKSIAERPQMVKQPEAFDTSEYSNDGFAKISEFADRAKSAILGLEPGFVEIGKNQDSTKNYITNLNKKLSQTVNNIGSFIKNKDATNDVQLSLFNEQRKAAANAKRDAEEAASDSQEKVADTSRVRGAGLQASPLGLPNIFETALDFLSGDDFLRDGKKRAGRTGRRGAGRLARRTAIKLGGKKTASLLGGKAIVKFLRPIFKRIPIVGGLIDFVVSLALGEPIGRAAAKAVGATLGGALGTLVPIPGVGTVLGGIVGDLIGGAVYDAIAGKPEEEKLSQGGVVAGEAGNELILPLTSKRGREVTSGLKDGSPLPFVGPFLSAAAGIVANPMYSGVMGPLINPILKPLLSEYKISPNPTAGKEIQGNMFQKAQIKGKQQDGAMTTKKKKKNAWEKFTDWLGGAWKGITNFFTGGGREDENSLSPNDVNLGSGSPFTGFTPYAAPVNTDFYLYTIPEMVEILKRAGATDDEAVKLAAVGIYESGGDATNDTDKSGLGARTGEYSIGLFQVNWNAHHTWLKNVGITDPDQLRDPDNNARAALQILRDAGGMSPWGAWSKVTEDDLKTARDSLSGGGNDYTKPESMPVERSVAPSVQTMSMELDQELGASGMTPSIVFVPYVVQVPVPVGNDETPVIEEIGLSLHDLYSMKLS